MAVPSDNGVSYKLSNQAYLKIILHAAKHPHRPANGVLLGKMSDSGVVIEDSIPLLHHWTSLSPMMEIGLDLVQTHAASVGLKLVGYYQACSRIDDTSLAPVGEKVAESVREGFKDAVAFVLDGEKLRTGNPALIPYLPLSGTSSWRPSSNASEAFTQGSRFSLASQDSPSLALQCIQEKHLQQKIGDFDDHLEDVSIDWLRNRDCMADIP